jgi:flagella basal body P-ring formation protein FlgA
MPLNAVAAHILRSERDIVGKEAKRILLPGRPIASHSIVEPRAILRGDNVTITYAKGILDLTAPGRALEEGAVDDIVRIVNLQSSKTITARIVQEGIVRVEPVTFNIPNEVQ